MTTLFVLKVAVIYGMVAGGLMWVVVCVLVAILLAAQGAIGTQPQGLLRLLGFCLFFMVGISVFLVAPVYRLTIAVLWNGRARALREMPPRPPPSPLAYENSAFSSDRPEDLP